MSGIWLFTFWLNLQGDVLEYSAYPQPNYETCILNKDRLEDTVKLPQDKTDVVTVVYECIDTKENITPEDVD